jgi:hypothetical protein
MVMVLGKLEDPIQVFLPGVTVALPSKGRLQKTSIHEKCQIKKKKFKMVVFSFWRFFQESEIFY